MSVGDFIFTIAENQVI